MAGLLAWIAGGAALAHVTGTGLATVDWQGDRAIVRLTLAPTEVAPTAAPVLVAATQDAAAARQVGDWLQQHVQLAVDERPCRTLRTQVQGSAGGDRVVLLAVLQCHATPGRLALSDTLTTVFGEHYRTITSVARLDGTRTERVFDHEHTRATFDFGASASEPAGGGYFSLGVGHILFGWDHLLFLAALLIGTRGVRSLLITITAFTVAHSITLAAATLGWVRASPVWVEPVIAASVLWMALENLIWQRREWRRHALTFVFGLVHGLGFAAALLALQLSGWPLARALVGFNLGVEAAQAAVVLIVAPLLARVATTQHGTRIERALSIVIAAAGGVWLVQRLAGA
jgi:hypothetical protein